MADTTEPREFTVDELAQHAGLPTSTIRMYQNRGLLDPPEKRGRVGWYGSAHVARLELIANLKERGFSLAGIHDLVTSWQAGGSLTGLLGVDQLAPALQRTAVRIPLQGLQEALGQTSVTQKEIQSAQDLGVIELHGAEFVVPDERFLRSGRELSSMGMSLSETLEELHALSAQMDPIVDRFRAVFDRHVWDAFEERGQPEDEIPALAETVEQLARIATDVVDALLSREFIRLADEYLTRVGAGKPSVTP